MQSELRTATCYMFTGEHLAPWNISSPKKSVEVVRVHCKLRADVV